MITGNVAPGFDAVRNAFERCFDELGETGAAFSARVRGRPVADLRGGEGFQRDSLVHVYSVTKPMAAFLRARAIRPRPGRSRRCGGSLLAGVRPGRKGQ